MKVRKRPARRFKNAADLYYFITKPDKHGREKKVELRKTYKNLTLLFISSEHQLPKYYIVHKNETVIYRCYGQIVAEKRFEQCCEKYNLFTS